MAVIWKDARHPYNSYMFSTKAEAIEFSQEYVKKMLEKYGSANVAISIEAPEQEFIVSIKQALKKVRW